MHRPTQKLKKSGYEFVTHHMYESIQNHVPVLIIEYVLRDIELNIYSLWKDAISYDKDLYIKLGSRVIEKSFDIDTERYGLYSVLEWVEKVKEFNKPLLKKYLINA